MAAPIWTIDGAGPLYPGATYPGATEYPAGSGGLTITSSPYFLTSQQLPLPDLDAQYGSSVTTEGDRLQTQRYRNRKITLALRVIGSSAANLQTAINDLQAKVGKINRDAVIGGTGYGGTLQYTTVKGDTVIFDVCSATMSAELGRPYVVRNGTDVTLEFECAPFARQAEVTLSDHTSGGPFLTFTESSIAGDVPALGRLVIDNDSTYDQATALWGLRSYHYSSSASAALWYEAETMTPMNAGASLVAAFASGTGNNAIRATALTTAYQPIAKSTVTSGGTTTYWTHKGAYRLYARFFCSSGNTGNVSMRASWAQADIVNFTTNAEKTLQANYSWHCMDLGVVRIPPTSSRWELRVEAKSTVNGDDVYLDWVALVPIDEGSGLASIASTPAVALAAQDTFEQSTGPSGQALTVLGGTWATAGATGDFAMDTANKRLKRQSAGDGGTTSLPAKNGRFIVESGSSGYAGQRASVYNTWATTYNSWSQGVLLRYVNTSNYAVALILHAGGYTQLRIYTVIAGTQTLIAQDPTPLVSGATSEVLGYPNVFTRLEASAYANGTITATATNQNGYTSTITGTSSDLATGGTLATGKYGIYSWDQAGSNLYWDDFKGWQIGTTDATVYASRSLTVSYNDVHRQNSTGAVSTRPSQYAGDYMLVPASGKESRTVQFAVRLGRGLIDGSGDSGNGDALSARLYVQPRYLQLPS